MYDTGNTNPELNSCKSTHSMSNTHTECRFLYEILNVTNEGREITYSKIYINNERKIYVMYDTVNTNPELNSCKSTHSMSNTHTECRFEYEIFYVTN